MGTELDPTLSTSFLCYSHRATSCRTRHIEPGPVLALAVGSLAGVLGGGRIAAVRRPGLVMALIAVGWGLALLPLVAITHLIPAVAFMGIAGLIWGPYTMIATSLCCSASSPHLCGDSSSAHGPRSLPHARR